MDNNYVPVDYEDLYYHYILGRNGADSLAKMLIRSFVPYADEFQKEELLANVFQRAFEKDILKVFDPTKANFGGIVFTVVRSVCVNYLQRKDHNPLLGLNAGTIVDKVDEEEFEPGVYALDQIFRVEVPNLEAQMDAKNLVSHLFAKARDRFLSPQNKRDQSLLPLLDFVMEGYDPKECAAKLGVTPSTIYNWMNYLGDMARQVQAELASLAA